MLTAVSEPNAPVAPHPDIARLAPLLGVWRGSGHGEYPTIDSFDYQEEIHFGHVGRPFLTYRQRTRHATDGRSLHAETGYLRCAGPDRIELILAHPTGISEIWVGEADGAKVELRTDVVARTETAKEYTAGHRLYGLVQGDLLWAFDMAAMGQPMQSHLSAQLKPTS